MGHSSGNISQMRAFNTVGLPDLRALLGIADKCSGYNPFHYLQELRFECVKIDDAFARNILNSKTDYALVHNLTRLWQDIGILTAAEFVENQANHDALKGMGVDYGQGFHISMPTREMP